MSEKLKVGILGATGMVGQRFITLLENHPWFEVVTLAASAHSAGKTYAEAVGDRWKMETPMPEYVKNMVVVDGDDAESVASGVDFMFSAVNMPKDQIRAIEERYAKTETPVVSNNSAHRWTPDVPMVVPEINPEHFEVIEHQRKRHQTEDADVNGVQIVKRSGVVDEEADALLGRDVLTNYRADHGEADIQPQCGHDPGHRARHDDLAPDHAPLGSQ